MRYSELTISLSSCFLCVVITSVRLRRIRRRRAQHRDRLRAQTGRLSAAQKDELRLRLATMSRAEALAALRPTARGKKAPKGKAKAKAKAVHAKAECKADTPAPSASAKASLGQSLRRKMRDVLAAQAAGETLDELLPPLPPPAEPPQPLAPGEEPVQPPCDVAQGPLKGARLRCITDIKGRLWYGAEGECLSHSLSDDTVELARGATFARLTCRAAHCVRAETFRKPATWTNQNCMGRATKQSVLGLAGLWAQSPEDAVEPLQLVKSETTWLLDHQLCLGLHLLSWSTEVDMKTHGGTLEGLRFLDPLLLERYERSLRDSLPVTSNTDVPGAACPEAVTERLRQNIIQAKTNAKLLLVPVWAPEHWTLLSLSFSEDGSVTEVCYRDSLTQEHAGCRRRYVVFQMYHIQVYLYPST